MKFSAATTSIKNRSPYRLMIRFRSPSVALSAKSASHLPKKSGINFLIRRGKKLEDRFIGNAYMFTEEERKKLAEN